MHGCAQGGGLGGGFFVGVAAHITAANQFAVAGHVVQCLGKLGLRFGKLTFLFAQGCLKGARINGDQRVAFAHVLPFGKVHLLYFTRDARLYAHRG